MPTRNDPPEHEDGEREPLRQPASPDMDTDQLARSRKPQLVPPGTIIEDEPDDHQVEDPARTGVVSPAHKHRD